MYDRTVVLSRFRNTSKYHDQKNLTSNLFEHKIENYKLEHERGLLFLSMETSLVSCAKILFFFSKCYLVKLRLLKQNLLQSKEIHLNIFGLF